MAVTAKFIADFSSFNEAVTKAEAKLVDFSQGANRVSKTLASMTDKFSGRKLIQEAAVMTRAIDDIGGVSRLTSTQLKEAGAKGAQAMELMRARGLEVPPALRKIVDAATEMERKNSVWERAADGLNKFANGAKTVGVGLTAAVTAPIVAAGAAAIKLGMDAVESENLVSVSFGNMRSAADAWSKDLSKNLGLNQFELRKTAGTIFNMTTSMGLARDEAFAMSTGVAKLAADMASFRNIGIDEALVKLRSGLTGETEPLKAIGILVDEATVKTYAYKTGIAAVGDELTQQQKVMARWQAILAQTANDQGDLARTMDSPANQLRIMKTRLEEAATELGVQLMPMVTAFISRLGELIPKVQSAVEWFGKLPEPIKVAVVGLAGLAAGAGPVVFALGSIAGAVGNLIPLLKALGSAQTIAGLGSIVGLLANPAVLAAAAVIGGVGFAVYNFNQNLKALDASSDALGKPLKALEGSQVTIDNAAAALARFDASGQKAAQSINPLGREITAMMPAATQAASGFDALGVKLRAAEAEIRKLSDTQRTQLTAALKSGVFDLKELQLQTGLSESALKLFKDRLSEAASGADKFGDAMKELVSATGNFRKILDGIDGGVVEAVKHYLEAGVAQEKLATAYRLTATQVKAIAEAMEFEKKALEESERTIDASRAAAIGAAQAIGNVMAPALKDAAIATNQMQLASKQLLVNGKPIPAVMGLIGLSAQRAGENFQDAKEEARGLGDALRSLLNLDFGRVFADVGKFIKGGLSEIGKGFLRGIGQDLFNKAQQLIEAGVKKLWDALTTTPGEDVMRRVGQAWGIKISEAMGDQIAKDAKELFGGSRQAAELFNLKDIFAADQNNLGITKRNVEQAAKALHDVFSMIETGQMTIAQGAKVIDENWQDLVAAGTDAFGFVSGQIRELIELDRRFGTESKEVAAFLKEQADIAVASSNAVIASVEPLVKSWQDVKARVDAANKAWDEAKKRGDMSAMVKADKEWAKAQKELTALTTAHKQELEDLGQIALATFASAMAAGKTFAEALEAAGPGLQTLVDGFKALQIETDNAALKVLMLQAEILNKNPALVKGIGSLGSAFAALSNMGMLNVDTFGAMTRTGMQMYQRLQAEVAAVGGTTKDALLPMQDYLHKAQRAAEELGIPLDENTQMLIDQSKELGIWKESGKSATDKMVEGMDRLIGKVEELINRLLGIPNPVITPEFNMPELPQAPADWGSWRPDGDAQPIVDAVPMASGGMGTVTKPTLFLAGEAGPEQFAFSGANQTFGTASSGASSVQVGTISVTVQAAPGDSPKELGDKFVEALRTYAPLYEAVGTIAERRVA